MKTCNNCKTIFTDNSKSICPKCNLILSSNFSIYDQKDYVNEISNNSKTLWSISWRVFLMLFTLLGVLGVITGYNIYGHLKNLNNKINDKITKEFERPQITQTIRNVAKENTSLMIKNEIEPEVIKFKNSINILIDRTDSVIKDKSLSFTKDVNNKADNIDKKIMQIDYSFNQIKKTEAEILKIANEMNLIKDLAKPPSLRQVGFVKDTIGKGLKLTIVFEPNKNEPLGLISFKVTILDDTKLLKIGTDVKYGAYTGVENGKITKDKIGEYDYSLIGIGYPTVVIEVSKKCSFKIESNYLDEPFIVNKDQY